MNANYVLAMVHPRQTGWAHQRMNDTNFLVFTMHDATQ